MTNRYDSVKKLYKRQEELEQEYFSRKKDYDKTLEKIAEIDSDLNNIFYEVSDMTRQILGELEAQPESFSKVAQINERLNDQSKEVYQLQKQKLINGWEAYQKEYRKKQDLLEEEILKVRREK
ncbi:hypothetical protein NSA16_06960 [Ligilactobacillus murinus]|nr:hypothetical protein [Ligilactobacillus murinus]